MVNPDLPKFTAKYLGDQFFYFPLQIQQLEKYANLNLNMRLTEDPELEKGSIDFSFLFDIGS